MKRSNGAAFRSAVKGANFMTPNHVEYLDSGPYHCEIASGTGIYNDPIFGVTVVRSNKHDYKLSKMVYSLQEARDYVRDLPKIAGE